MPELYKVCIINKHDTDDLDDIGACFSKWITMSKEQLEKYLQITLSNDEPNGRANVGYSEIIWKKLTNED